MFFASFLLHNEGRRSFRNRPLCYKGSAMPGTEHDVSGSPVASDRDASPDHRPDEAHRRQASLPPDFEDNLTELIDTAERLAGNPVAAWGAIKAEVERRIAHRQEWAPSGTEMPTREGVEHDRPGQSTGGAMPTHPGVPAQARRQFIGFDVKSRLTCGSSPNCSPASRENSL